MIDLDSSRNIYIADRNYHTIRKITSTGVTSRIIGTGSCGQNSADGLGTSATLCYPYAVAVAPSNTLLYFTDTWNHKIRAYNMSNYAVITFAGSTAGSAGYVDGIGTNAKFNYPYGVAVDSSSYVYLSLIHI